MAPGEAAKYLLGTAGGLPFPISLSLCVRGWDDGTFRVF